MQPLIVYFIFKSEIHTHTHKWSTFLKCTICWRLTNCSTHASSPRTRADVSSTTEGSPGCGQARDHCYPDFQQHSLVSLHLVLCTNGIVLSCPASLAHAVLARFSSMLSHELVDHLVLILDACSLTGKGGDVRWCIGAFLCCGALVYLFPLAGGECWCFQEYFQVETVAIV